MQSDPERSLVTHTCRIPAQLPSIIGTPDEGRLGAHDAMWHAMFVEVIVCQMPNANVDLEIHLHAKRAAHGGGVEKPEYSLQQLLYYKVQIQTRWCVAKGEQKMELYASLADTGGPKKKEYWDRRTFSSLEEQQEAMRNSSTLYVGNLSFFTSETQIYELFSVVGPVKAVIMGLNQLTKTPCGFCFVEYFAKEHAQACSNFISGTKLDQRVIRCDLDGGFVEGRQYGRGTSGGQVRDDRRSKEDYDPGRGGYGKKEDDFGLHASHFRRPGVRKRSRTDSMTNDEDRYHRQPQYARKTSNDVVDTREEDKKEDNPRFQERDSDGEQDAEDDSEIAPDN
ncbi:Aste57867_4333 [Aphanomyces stellatus]|uniref:Aste57867_4333 protein n=1 Tax=Aphanomyces stellatus TaxID=120398 RepID=A0A485KGN8_9STRA|nr:hypothetical protein As57867_004322 [Aphanomyces stellatus]VFT81447.1 Aste57867_4333 [Aphanomyces stellatus]